MLGLLSLGHGTTRQDRVDGYAVCSRGPGSNRPLSRTAVAKKENRVIPPWRGGKEEKRVKMAMQQLDVYPCRSPTRRNEHSDKQKERRQWMQMNWAPSVKRQREKQLAQALSILFCWQDGGTAKILTTLFFPLARRFAVPRNLEVQPSKAARGSYACGMTSGSQLPTILRIFFRIVVKARQIALLPIASSLFFYFFTGTAA